MSQHLATIIASAVLAFIAITAFTVPFVVLLKSVDKNYKKNQSKIKARFAFAYAITWALGMAIFFVPVVFSELFSSLPLWADWIIFLSVLSAIIAVWVKIRLKFRPFEVTTQKMTQNVHKPAKITKDSSASPVETSDLWESIVFALPGLIAIFLLVKFAGWFIGSFGMVAFLLLLILFAL